MGREKRNQPVAAGQSETFTQAADSCPAHRALEARPPMKQGLGAETWGLESRLRQMTAVGYKETS